MKFATPLPIDAVLDELRDALATRPSAVLVAPPRAGKTTRVPLALMDESWLGSAKILVLEPRRIAARAAAERMAHTLSEAVGERIGLRARMVSKSGPKTQIEVVTEGVFTRMILDDPGLSGIGAVLFDEFHERSLDADLGLALALDCQAACGRAYASCLCRRRWTARGWRSFSATLPLSPAKAARSRSRRDIPAAMPTRVSRIKWRTR